MHLDEANELLAAWACQVATDRGIRTLLIKGRMLSDDGLRAVRVSADVDLLVEPTRFDEYCDAVLSAGWEEFPSTFASAHFTLHSRSFRKAGWPNSFDVHSEYPGFLRPPAEVFDALWQTRRTASFAHQECPVPSRVAGAMILALHSLRGTAEQARHHDELVGVLAVTFTDAERAELAALATVTGATPALADALPQWGVEVAVDQALMQTDAYRLWLSKTTRTEGVAGAWLTTLSRAPWRQKAQILRRALWPSHDDFAVEHPEVAGEWWPQTWARVARWGRGLRQLPGAVRTTRRRR